MMPDDSYLVILYSTTAQQPREMHHGSHVEESMNGRGLKMMLSEGLALRNPGHPKHLEWTVRREMRSYGEDGP